MKGAIILIAILAALGAQTYATAAQLRVGAAVVDVTPLELPVLVNGSFLSRTSENVNTKLHARAIVLDDGDERIAIVVVDSCMVPRPLLDEAKQRAAAQTDIRTDRMLIAATHTHSAPAVMSCLGTSADPVYAPYLREKLAEAIKRAAAKLQPAQVGWAVANAAKYTALRRWIRRPDRIEIDPFGNRTVRANMHAARNLDDVVGESGPEDPDLSLIAFQTMDGRPIAVLANFSMHYYGDRALSADYFGLFCKGLEDRLAGANAKDESRPIAVLSHGCSGDIWRRDYRNPDGLGEANRSIQRYTDGLLEIAAKAYDGIEYKAGAELVMAESRFELKYRTPNARRLEWAQRIVDVMGDRLPKDKTEVYAREQIILHERQSTEIVVQALRIGEIAIATTPNETYALTGLKLKRQSPLRDTMVIELANGGDGYIPPPEQHFLGGYNTWPARSAGLEVGAEPKIVAAALELLERVADRPRRNFQQPRGPASQAILDARPLAYWRLDEMTGPRAADASGNRRDAIYEPAVAYFLAGPHSDSFCAAGETNRAAHFAGGRLRGRFDELGNKYTVALWFWNGMPVDSRETAGWMFSRGHDHARLPGGDHLGIGGTASRPGRLIYLSGGDKKDIVAGRTEIERWSWNHVVLVRDDAEVRVHLNGLESPEIETDSPSDGLSQFHQFFFGGRCDNTCNWEGRLDEIAVFDRALSAEEIQSISNVK